MLQAAARADSLEKAHTWSTEGQVFSVSAMLSHGTTCTEIHPWQELPLMQISVHIASSLWG